MVGDVMLDEFVWGSVSRISPDAPVPVVLKEHRSCRLSGALIAARVARALSGRVTAVGVVGDDGPGGRLLRLTAEAGIDDGILVDPARPTTVKTRVYAQGQQLLRMDDESTEPVGGVLAHSLTDAVLELLEEADVLVLSDYRKGVLTADVAKRLINAGRAHGIPVVVDTKRADAERFRGATIMTPNALEMAAMADSLWAGHLDFADRATHIIGHYDLSALLVTQDRDGMTLVSRDGASLSVSALPVDSPNAAGAGDAVVGALAACLAAEVPLGTALDVARLAACCLIRQQGTLAVSLEALTDLAAAETELV
ncbi:PfkB family carbohydrate kinase [Streptomyces canus]|uniref:bifunctional heptose 7-phosphate kinase/heptose 1-phosphate adenyltransferase n=1 Tax=Streptomyces canus TaxID=58343 RepID=UPI0030DF739E